jgi:hypothetical protein
MAPRGWGQWLILPFKVWRRGELGRNFDYVILTIMNEAVRCRGHSKTFRELYWTGFHINNRRGRIYSGFVADTPDIALAITMPAKLMAATNR